LFVGRNEFDVSRVRGILRRRGRGRRRRRKIVWFGVRRNISRRGRTEIGVNKVWEELAAGRNISIGEGLNGGIGWFEGSWDHFRRN